MVHLIDKDALVAEIRKRQKIHFNDYHINGNNSPADYGACNALTQILDFIDTLKVEGVCLERELESWRHNHFHGRRDNEANGDYLKRNSQLCLAKHFFELGLKAQKRE